MRVIRIGWNDDLAVPQRRGHGPWQTRTDNEIERDSGVYSIFYAFTWCIYFEYVALASQSKVRKSVVVSLPDSELDRDPIPDGVLSRHRSMFRISARKTRLRPSPRSYGPSFFSYELLNTRPLT